MQLQDSCGCLSESATPQNLEKPAAKPKKSSKLEKVGKEKANQTANVVKFKNKTPTLQVAPKADYEQLNLTEEQLKIIKALSRKKLTFDEITSSKRKLCDPEKAYEILLDMELDGIIEKISGDRYSIIK